MTRSRAALWLLLVLVTSLATGCVYAQPPAFDPERALAAVSGGAVRDFWTQDFGRARLSGGHSALVPADAAKALLMTLRADLPDGYVAFVGTTRNLEDPSVTEVELVIARGRNQFDIVRLAATDGVNHGHATDDIIARLKAWDRQTGIDVWQAEADTIQMDLTRDPPDPDAFAKALHTFCPDILEGMDGLESLQKTLRKGNTVHLWWD